MKGVNWCFISAVGLCDEQATVSQHTTLSMIQNFFSSVASFKTGVHNDFGTG